MNERKIGIFISYLNIFLQTLINIIYVPILLHYIGKSEYGLYQLIGSFIAYFSIMDFGLTAAVTRFYTKYKALNDKLNMENILAISMRGYIIVTFILIFLGSICYWQIENIFHYSMTPSEITSAKKLLILLLLNVMISMLGMVFRAVINAHEKFLFLKGIETVQLVLQPILIILILQEYPYAFSVALIQTILNLVLNILRYIYCKKKLNITIKYHYWDSILFKEFKKLALSVFLVTIIDQIFFKTNQIILGIVSGTTAVAIYAIASLIYMNYMALSVAISSVYLPHITELIAKKEPIKVLSNLFIEIGRWQYFLLGAVLSSFIIFGQQFINIWAGEGFEESYWITLLIIVPFTIDLIQNIGLVILQAQNRYNFRAKIYFFMGIFNICLAIPLGITYGGIGCAFATGLSMFIGNGLIMNWYYSKVIGLDIIAFWNGILLITIQILGLFILFLVFNLYTYTSNNIIFICKLILYSICYSFIIYKFCMNDIERLKVKHIFIKRRKSS